MKETQIFQQLVYARWAWKELFRRNLWGIKNVVINVNCKTHTITLPVDCERLINISVKDCAGKIQPLTCDPNLSTVEMNCVKPKCGCTKCEAKDTLCELNDVVSYSTETVEIQGTDYTMQIWTRYSNGAIQEERSIPTLGAGNVVTYTTQITTLCNVDVTDQGCIKATPTNMLNFQNHCGCGIVPDNQTGIAYRWYWNTKNLIPQVYNYFGYWNYNAQDRSIIHIFRYENGHNWWGDVDGVQNGIYQVIVSYQTNGETSGEEILVPQFAQHALEMGIMWQQKLFNTKASGADKSFAKDQWSGAKVLVNKHLNTIRLEVLEKLQTQERRW